MKIGIFTDPHYSIASLTCGNRYNSASLEKMKKALTHFRDQGCELVIVLGDVTDTEPTRAQEEENLRQIAQVFDASGLEIVCLMGNHDAFVFTPDDFYAIIGEKRRPRGMERGGRHLLFLDACYFASGAHYQPGDSDWTDTFYPHVRALEETLSQLYGDAYVFLHQNIDQQIPENHRLSNDAQIRSILERSGKVRAVFQGHYHPGCRSEKNGIAYTTFPAMCEREDAYFVMELA